MTFAYDLVIIGATQEAIFAAITATRWKARVALVAESFANIDNEMIYSLSLQYYASKLQQSPLINSIVSDSSLHSENELLSHLTIEQSLPPELAQNCHLFSQIVINSIKEARNPALLSAWGVDVIVGKGEFCRLPQEALIVNNRKLRSRCYLLATGCTTAIPNIPNLEDIGYLTVNNVINKPDFNSISDHLAIIGHSFLSLELAQSLAKMGKKVILINDQERLLPQEDLETAMLLQAQLEVDGVEIYNHSPITQIKLLDDQKWLQAGIHAIATDEIIFSDCLQPNITDLNLEAVGVKFNQKQLQVNRKLQTTNPNIYGCGNLLGGYNLGHLAQYEAKIAVKNALFAPLFKVNYDYIPWVMLTQPNLARVGLSASQAKKRYGADVVIVQQDWKLSPLAQITGETTGFCQLVTRNNGEILGACLIGTNAAEIISAIALAMQAKIKIEQLGQFLTPNLTYAAIIQQTVNQWQYQKLQNDRFRQNLLQSWFNWRKNL